MIIIYSKPNCSNCIKLKNLLKDEITLVKTLGVDFTSEWFRSKFEPLLIKSYPVIYYENLFYSYLLFMKVYKTPLLGSGDLIKS
jgi:glutaredoxin